MAFTPTLALIEKVASALVEAQNWHAVGVRAGQPGETAAHEAESCPVCLAQEAAKPLIRLAMQTLEASLEAALAAPNNRSSFQQFAQDLAACDVALTRIGVTSLAQPHLVWRQAELRIGQIAARLAADVEGAEIESDAAGGFAVEGYTRENAVQDAIGYYVQAYQQAVRQLYT